MMRDILKDALIGSLLSTRQFMKEVKEGFKEQAKQSDKEAKAREEKQKEVDGLEVIQLYVSDVVSEVMQAGRYDYFLKDVYGNIQTYNEFGEPIETTGIVNTVRKANVTVKPLLDVPNSQAFRVEIVGEISQDDLIVMNDYFKRVQDYKYKRVGILANGFSKQLVFAGTNDREADVLISEKLASRDETKMPYR